MSALGQKQPFRRVRIMSALPPKADMLLPKDLPGNCKKVILRACNADYAPTERVASTMTLVPIGVRS